MLNIQLSMVVDQMNVKGVTAHTVQYHSEKLHHFMRTFQRVKVSSNSKIPYLIYYATRKVNFRFEICPSFKNFCKPNFNTITLYRIR